MSLCAPSLAFVDLAETSFLMGRPAIVDEIAYEMDVPVTDFPRLRDAAEVAIKQGLFVREPNGILDLTEEGAAILNYGM